MVDWSDRRVWLGGQRWIWLSVLWTNRLVEVSKQIGYDAEGLAKTSTVAATSAETQYGCDGGGRRVTKTTGGVTTWYVYDAFGNLAAEYASSGPTGSAETQYVTTDHLGSTRLVTNQSGAVVSRHDYLPFGEEMPSNLGGRTTGMGYGANTALAHRFTGKERDTESGLDYFGARYLSSVQGRFGSPDPFNPILEFQSKSDDDRDIQEAQQQFDSYIANPQHWNRYGYGLNNPFTYVDRDGRVPVLVVAWAAFEIGSAIYDAYTAYKTVQDPNASSTEKSIAVAGLGASLLLPGGGYGTGGKRVAKEILEASGAQMHHIATNKNILGGFTKQFEKIFNAAGLSLDDGINKMILRGHAHVRHTPQYHQYVLGRLSNATQGLRAGSQQYRNAVAKTLEELRQELLDNPDMISWTNF